MGAKEAIEILKKELDSELILFASKDDDADVIKKYIARLVADKCLALQKAIDALEMSCRD